SRAPDGTPSRPGIPLAPRAQSVVATWCLLKHEGAGRPSGQYDDSDNRNTNTAVKGKRVSEKVQRLASANQRLLRPVSCRKCRTLATIHLSLTRSTEMKSVNAATARWAVALLAAVALTTTAPAQPGGPRGPVVVSPEVKPDRHIVFRLLAPKAEA